MLHNHSGLAHNSDAGRTVMTIGGGRPGHDYLEPWAYDQKQAFALSLASAVIRGVQMMVEHVIPDDPRRRPRRIPPPKPLTVTIDDTCKITGLGNTKIYELINQGKLKSIAIGRRRLVLYSSIEALLEQDAA